MVVGCMLSVVSGRIVVVVERLFGVSVCVCVAGCRFFGSVATVNLERQRLKIDF